MDSSIEYMRVVDSLRAIRGIVQFDLKNTPDGVGETPSEVFVDDSTSSEVAVFPGPNIDIARAG